MKRTAIGWLALGIVLAAATAALAIGPGFGPGRGMGYSAGMMGPGTSGGMMGPGTGGGMMGSGPAALPTLTPEQQGKLTTLHQEFVKETAPLRTELHTKWFELRTLYRTEPRDQAKIETAEKTVQDLRAQLYEKATKNREALLAILTPEQRAQLGTVGPHGMMWGTGTRQGVGPGRGMGYGPRAMGAGPGAGFGPCGAF
ncbi:MAG: Spy/CpxP family protein refolding chaperone [Deltaproteobacteria bacterium]|nr:Spy/CpxP family protein refolding chaperone [Deltaproteobacteria bacterium]MBI3078819.1 Spy/CpxP family protein refolding chaperone [Deltaproteobacteria bacterium]